jgi:hypothetical protein
MINCIVTENKMGHLTVVFLSGKSLYIQSDYDKAAFSVDCEVIKAPENWDGQPSNLPDDWWNIEWEDITKCPDYYETNAPD